MSIKKDKLNKDIDNLKEDVSNYLDDKSMHKLCFEKIEAKENLEQLKQEYKKVNKEYLKNRRIKNLAITGKISLFLVPIVLVPAICGTIVAVGDYPNDNIKQDVSYVEECVYLDNYGNEYVLTDENLINDIESDIIIETEYKKQDEKVYYKNIYTYEDRVYDIDTAKEIVNTNYLELINDLEGPISSETIISDKIDESNNKAKISVAINQYREANPSDKNIISGEKIKSDYNDMKISNGIFVSFLCACCGLPIGFLLSLFLRDKIKYKIDLYDRYNSISLRNEMKSNIKNLKKKIKKM
ncbi:MAG: hypothetical protein ACI4OT_01545 [Bacilli bacterium]